jgi:hypothetical protein
MQYLINSPAGEGFTPARNIDVVMKYDGGNDGFSLSNLYVGGATNNEVHHSCLVRNMYGF